MRIIIIKIKWNNYIHGDEPKIDPSEHLRNLCKKEFSFNKNWKKAVGYLKRKEKLFFDKKENGWCIPWHYLNETRNIKIADNSNDLLNENSIRQDIIEDLENEDIINILTNIGYEFIILSMYEHGGLALKKGIHNGWDSGICGYCVISKDKTEKTGLIKNNAWRKCARNIMDMEIEDYGCYISDETFYYELFEMDEKEYRQNITDNKEVTDEELKSEDYLIESAGGIYGNKRLDKLKKEMNL